MKTTSLRRFLSVAASVSALVVTSLGCTTEVIVDGNADPSGTGAGGAGQGGAAAGGASQGGNTAGTAGGTTGVDVECEALCAVPAEEGCFNEADCVAFCEANEPSWDASAVEAFSHCAETEPLCFETIENCTVRVLHPDPIVVDVVVTGSGMGDAGGLTMTLGFNEDNQFTDLQSATISAGSFSLQWTREMQIDWMPGVGFHLDSNNDQQCDDGDATGLVTLIRQGPLQAPSLAVEITSEELGKGGFLCEYF